MAIRLFGVALLTVVLAACAGNRAPAALPHKAAVSPPNAQRLAPYSTAVRTGNLVFLSGVIGRRTAPADTTTTAFEAEVADALQTVRNNLAAVKLTPDDVVKCTVFLTDIAHYTPMNRVYGEFFGTTNPPARSAIAVQALPANARVEIECIAAVPQSAE